MEDLKDFLLQQYQKRLPYLKKEGIEAYRLTGNSGRHPFAIDIYGNSAVIHIFAESVLQESSLIEEGLNKLLGIKDFFYKNRTRLDLKLPSSSHREIIVNEHGNKFLINLSDYQDVGLFLDHREARKWIGSISKGKTVLNTFAYSGSFSIYAANAGALKTYSVDLSRAYCDWIKKNIELNSLSAEKNWVYKMDTMEFFHYAAKKGLKFDIIVIDPPTFSKNKKENFSVQKDHPKLLNAALELLNRGGLIFFSNNFTQFILKKELLLPSVIQRRDFIPFDFEGQFPHKGFIIRKK